jgi:ATP-dependent Lon protease
MAAWAMLSSLIDDALRPRADRAKIHIWHETGVEPPDFAWSDDPACSKLNPARIYGRPGTYSARPVVARGFDVYVRAERALREARADAAPRVERLKKAVPLFVDTIGAMALFSMAEAEPMYYAAEQQASRETKDYLMSRLAALVASGNRRPLMAAPTSAQIDGLRARFPNAAEVIDVIDRAAALSRLSANQAFEMPPMLILGEPGVGKTALAQAFATVVAAPFQRIDIGTLSSGSQLFGVSLSWSTGATGQIFNLLAGSACGNPVVFLDELDKAQGNDNAKVIPPLLSLLEPETSRTFRDEAVPIALNASQVIWLATANDLSEMSSPLRSRVNVVTMWRPEGEEALVVAGEVYRSIRGRERWGSRFPAELERAVLLRLAAWTPREMARWVKLACGEAARSGRLVLQASDIPVPCVRRRARVGFL